MTAGSRDLVVGQSNEDAPSYRYPKKYLSAVAAPTSSGPLAVENNASFSILDVLNHPFKYRTVSRDEFPSLPSPGVAPCISRTAFFAIGFSVSQPYAQGDLKSRTKFVDRASLRCSKDKCNNFLSGEYPTVYSPGCARAPFKSVSSLCTL